MEMNLKTEPAVPAIQESYCRFCLKEDELRHLTKSVRKCVANEYSIETSHDGLSTEICVQCNDFIKEIMEFREKRNNYGLLISKKNELLMKIVKRKITKLEDNASIDLTDNSIPDNNVCSINDTITKVVQSIDLTDIDDTEETIRKSQPLYFCNVCKINNGDLEKFKRHIKTPTHNYKTFVVEETGNCDLFLTHTIGYTCPYCTEIFTGKNALSKHSRTQHQLPLNKEKIQPNAVVDKSIMKKRSEDTIIELSQIAEKRDLDSTMQTAMNKKMKITHGHGKKNLTKAEETSPLIISSNTINNSETQKQSNDSYEEINVRPVQNHSSRPKTTGHNRTQKNLPLNSSRPQTSQNISNPSRNIKTKTAYKNMHSFPRINFKQNPVIKLSPIVPSNSQNLKTPEQTYSTVYPDF